MVEGNLSPTSELALHLGVYDASPAGAVVHTHAPFATAIACVLDALPVLPHTDHLLPNDEQVLGFTGSSLLAEGARALLDHGVGCVAVTQGARGALVVDASGAVEVPAYEIEVVDTTGCGDAFSAGFLRGLSLGRSPAEAAALGCASAAQVAQGLGTDAGAYDLTGVEEFRESAAAG